MNVSSLCAVDRLCPLSTLAYSPLLSSDRSLQKKLGLSAFNAYPRTPSWSVPISCSALPQILEIARQPQIRVPQATNKAKARLAHVLIKQLLVLVEELDNYDKAIMQLFKAHDDARIFAGLPGAGKRLAPKLLAEWGDNRALYDSFSSVQALAGTSPVAFQSGKYNKARRRTSCVKPFRNALYEFAWCSVRWEPWAKEYYYRKRKEGKSHHVAIRSLANN